MESFFDVLFTRAPLVTGGVLILVALLSMIFRPSESFNVPFVGVEDRDMSKMKAKYVHEADTLLREGYDKVCDGFSNKCGLQLTCRFLSSKHRFFKS